MVYYASTATFGSLTLFIVSLNADKVEHAKNQIINKVPKRLQLADSGLDDWDIRIEGTFYDGSKDANRVTLEGYRGQKVRFEDGVHDGDYIITSLVFDDNREKYPSEHYYRMSLIQDQ